MTHDEILKIINSRSSLPANMAVRKHIERGKSILITGGIGDFIAIEPFILSNKPGISQIYLATRGWLEIAELIRKAYPSIAVKNIIQNFPRNKYCFLSYKDCFSYMREKNIKIPSDLTQCQDCSIIEIFPQIEKNHLEFAKSKFIENTFQDIKSLNLPKKYISLVSASSRDASHASRGRNLMDHEILNIKSKVNLPLVCVYCECINPDPDIIHMRKTNIFESIEIVKNSVGYIGIDSWLSVVAGWIFKETNMVVKCINDHGIRNRNSYWPILKDPSFLYRDLGENFIFQT